MRRREFLRWLGFAGATVAAAPALAVVPHPVLAAAPAVARPKLSPLSEVWKQTPYQNEMYAMVVHPHTLHELLVDQNRTALQTALGRKVDAAIFEDYYRVADVVLPSERGERVG